MKKFIILLFSVLFMGFSQTLKTQTADETIGNLINTGNWFALAEEYPKQKDKMQSEMLKNFSEVMIGFYFNQPQQALNAIDWLIANAQNEIGFDNVSTMILFKSMILGEQGFYAESADNLNNFLKHMSAYTDTNAFPVHIETARYYEKMRNNARPEIIRPDKDTQLPIVIENIGLGELIYIPVTINGKVYKFIFDTGAGSTYISKRLADVSVYYSGLIRNNRC